MHDDLTLDGGDLGSPPIADLTMRKWASDDDDSMTADTRLSTGPGDTLD